ncbi:TolC family protein [Guyparkeria halophila]|uniref:TolC family protein n=1 Tax=Guyparkeria halophila TaxID=47960 RepID=A0ABZ0YVZ4_9GAMM|nr:TolC family protein [Guyparkeria halophila]WQH16351.1 TolC family protein [Guyparkeria halophila]
MNQSILSRAAAAWLVMVVSTMPTLADSLADTGPRLTLEAAVQAATQSDEGLQAADRRRAGLAATAEAADELPDPRLSVALQNVPTDNYSLSDSPMTQTVVTLSQSLPPGDTLSFRGEQAEARVAGSVAALTTADHQLKRDVRRLWLAIYREEALGHLLETERELYRELLESARTAYQVNEASGSDLVALQARLSRIGDALDRRQGEAQAARARLARWVGEAAERPLPESLPASLTDEPTGELDHQPELERLRAELEAARAQVGEAEAQFAPEIGLQVGYGLRAGSEPNTLSAGVSVSLPIFAERRQSPRLRGAQQSAQAAQLDLTKRARDLAAEADGIRARLAALDRRITRYQNDIIPELQQVAEMIRGEIGAGRGEFDALIEAERAVVEARQELLTLRLDRADQLIDLRYLLEPTA